MLSLLAAPLKLEVALTVTQNKHTRMQFSVFLSVHGGYLMQLSLESLLRERSLSAPEAKASLLVLPAWCCP